MAITVKCLGTGSTGNCYLVSNGVTRILLDAGLPIKKIREAVNLSTVDGVLITHSHRDHCGAVNQLLKAACDVWMPEKEIKKARLADRYNLHPLKHDNLNHYECFPVGAFAVKPFMAAHDTPEPVAYILQSNCSKDKLLYLTDSQYITAFPQWVTHMICEINYVEKQLYDNAVSGNIDKYRYLRTLKTHMGLEAFVSALAQINLGQLQEIYICHMSNDNGNEKLISEAVQNAAPLARVTIF